VYYYHLDQLNTPRFVTNKNAEVVWQNQADVYGYEELEADTDFNKENTFTQPIRFQGQYFDEESGLHYNRYRYYSPKQQRFINQDPIGLVGGINHYQYAPNPVNWVDPFGLSCKEGIAKIYRYGTGSEMHFAIEVLTKNWKPEISHQFGAKGTPTAILDFHSEDMDSELNMTITVSLPNAVAAREKQVALKNKSYDALSLVDYDPMKLNTPMYDVEKQSCLTHVFDVLKAGGRDDAPDTSEVKESKKYLFKLAKEERQKNG
jgi:RHS repeat-associated protein